MARLISFPNICSLDKLPIRPLLVFKSSSRKFSIISSPNTRNAGLVLEHSFSGIPTNKLGHHFARNHVYATGGNEFSQFSRQLESPSSTGDDTDSYSNNSALSHEDSFLILRRQLEVQGAFDLVKDNMLPILLQKLKQVRRQNVTVKSGLETAASIDLLRLFGASSCKLDDIGRSALQGARLLEEGQNKVNNGKGMLKSAFDEIPKHLEF